MTILQGYGAGKQIKMLLAQCVEPISGYGDPAVIMLMMIVPTVYFTGYIIYAYFTGK